MTYQNNKAPYWGFLLSISCCVCLSNTDICNTCWMRPISGGTVSTAWDFYNDNWDDLKDGLAGIPIWKEQH
ncbi:hypothetical protein Vspart_03988 [Vibrio spartinae]|uniref:Uncharacterized protein n=1 Tax=Vibrio spartinae TaxID=1918945 RepID=A0ABX6R5K8_9VIBR|nr:hypothetical protein Vspart_03988 [Vibrio spartinae]